jgi:hypothetical protein
MSEFVYKEISCPSDVVDDAFSKNVQTFKFNVGAPYVWHPNKSFFKIEMELTEAGGKPTTVFLNENSVACMYDSAIFKAGGRDVSFSSDGNLPQVQQAKTRLTTSLLWQESVGKSIMGLGSNAERSDEMKVYNSATPPAVTHTQNAVSRIWQPAIGIFDRTEAVGSGAYSISLTPSSKYDKKAVNCDVNRSIGVTQGTVDVPGTPEIPEDLVAGTPLTPEVLTTYLPDTADYELKIKKVKFYMCQSKSDAPTNPVFTLRETEAHSKLVSSDTTLEFTIPSSTTHISCFLQDSNAGTTNPLSLTSFTIEGGLELNLIGMQVSYAGVTKPPTRVGSVYNADTNQYIQRYLQCHLESGMGSLGSGCETLSQYIEKGPIDHFSFIKSQDNKDTQVQVSITAPGIPDNTNLFLLAHYTRITETAESSGHIVDVKTFNI